MFVATVAEFLSTAFTFIPRDVWDASWWVAGGDPAVYAPPFMNLYHLISGTELVGDADIDVVRPADGYALFWPAVWALLVAQVPLCPDGCNQSQRPTP